MTQIPGVSFDYGNRSQIILGHKRESHSDSQEEMEVCTFSKNQKAYDVTPNSVIYVNLEGFYDGNTFLPKITLPLTLRSFRWGWGEKSEAEKMLPVGCSYAVLSLVFKNAFVGCATFRGRKAYLRDVEGKFVNSEGKYEKLLIPKGAEVDFFIVIEQVEETVDPFVQPLFPTKYNLYLSAIRAAKIYMKTGCYEAAATKLDVVLKHIFVMDPMQNVDLIPDSYMLDLHQIPLIVLRLFVELYGKLDEKLYGAKDAIKHWDKAIELVISMRRVEQDRKFLGTAYFERGLLQWNLNELQAALEDFKIALAYHLTYYYREEELTYEKGQLIHDFWEDGGWEAHESNIVKINQMIAETEAKIESRERRLS